MPDPHDIDFEIGFYEGLLAECPDFLQAMAALGDLYTQKGWYDKGLDLDLTLAARRPDDPYVYYNLACSYSLLGRVDESLQAMQVALDNGYDDFEHLLRDTDLNRLKSDPRFRMLLQQRQHEKTP